MTMTNSGKPVKAGKPAKSEKKSREISPKKIRVAAFLGVMGPGVLAGLSDDDPAGITTYSQLGAHYGYRLMWVLLVSTIALIIFQDLGARIGVVTRQGLLGLVRQKYGARSKNSSRVPIPPGRAINPSASSSISALRSRIVSTRCSSLACGS